MKIVTLRRILHRDQFWLALSFHYDPDLSRIVKQLPGIRYTKTHRAWLVDFNLENINMVLSELEPFVLIERSEIEMYMPGSNAALINERLEKFIHYMRSRRYSENTIKTYLDAVRVFFRFFREKLPEDITNQDVITFNNRYILAKELSHSYQSQVINGIKLFFNQVESKKLEVELIHRPRREKLLPNVLSKNEVKRILDSIKNQKHRTMLCMIYSCGLRCGELLRLEPADIQSSRNLLIVRKSKGMKDRVVPLSEKMLGILREYYKIYKPQKYLFEGQKIGEMYDARSLQMVMKKAINAAGIRKPATLHWLRHSYATHLLESGTDLRYIQEILGHRSSRTTEIYTHVSMLNIQSIRSPFDTL